MRRPIVFVDTETNTLGPLARPWETALIRRDEAGAQEMLWHVSDPLPAGTDPEALKLNGYAWRCGSILVGDGHVDGHVLGPEWKVARQIHEQLQGVVLVGVGVHFDAAVLSAMFRRHGLDDEPWHYSIVDLKAATWGALIEGHVGGVRTEASAAAVQLPMRSEQLAAALGVQPPADGERHTALGDARWAARWFDALTGGGAS